MTLFWIISAAMIVAALALLAPTLLRQHRAGSDATKTFNVEIAREHLADLVKQRDAGELSDEEFAQTRQDVEMALAEDLNTDTSATAAPARSGGGRFALVAAALLLPLITVPVYFKIGSPGLIDAPPAMAAATGHGESSDMPPLSELVSKLRERMEAEPDNAEGWFLLGRTYMRLQQYNDAVYAFEKVATLLPDEVAGMLSLADALAMQNGGRVGMRSIELLEKALAIDPDSITALWLLGNAAADQGDNTKAVELWLRAYPLLADEPGMQAELSQLISRAGGEAPPSVANLPPIMGSPAMAATAAVDASPPAAADPGAADGAAIRVEVALAPYLMENADPNDTLFVLARAESGPPMPLAVARHRVGDLPLQVTLTDAMAMMPAMKLSSFARVKVSAKVSKSGQAGSQPGDLVAPDVVVDSANPPDSVQLLINQVVE